MDLWLKILKRYERIAIVLLTVILTVSFITITAEIGDLLKEQIWRLFTYFTFCIIFIFLLMFRKELFKK
jgi:hypothetical protein